MKGLEIRDFTPEDMGLEAETARAVASSFSGLTLRIDGEIAAYGGVSRIGPLWWSFVEIKDDRARRPHLICRLLLKGLQASQHRVHAYVDPFIPSAEKLHVLLGFRPLDPEELCNDIQFTKQWIENRVGQPVRIWVRDNGN